MKQRIQEDYSKTYVKVYCLRTLYFQIMLREVDAALGKNIQCNSTVVLVMIGFYTSKVL